MKTKNIVISGTNFWNPGDDFVRDGVIHILRRLLEDYTLNFLFYNFNQDFYPQSKFSGIHNMASAGDLDQYRELIDAVVITGLSAGNEIKDLYRWIIENGLLDRVYLVGAGYENTYVQEHICQEPEATVFKHARIITGRTEKRPSFITEHGLPYHHIACPAMLSVENVKNIPVQTNIRTIGFSIQLPHGVGVPNHSCDASMYKLAAHTLLELFPKYRVEIVAHHKQEYFHFLNLVKGHDIPVFFSSFYQDLYDIYRRFDVVISTRLHSCIYANSHGIPGIIVNDTDRHTHCADGFPNLICVNTKEKLYRELDSICRRDLRQIARDNEDFKTKLMQKYLMVLAGPFGIETHSPDDIGMPRTHPNSKEHRHSHNKANATQPPAEKDEITSKLFNSVCHDTHAKRRALQTISQLTRDYWLERNIEMFKAAIDSNASWFDTLSFLNWYAANFKPDNYLEVGVRRGRSLAQVLTQSPEIDAYGFDLWIPEYAGAANPGPDFVISELNRLGVKNLPTLIAGDSHETLPRFWSDTHNPQQFELILVDGDHTYPGAKEDLDICFAHLAPGGALLFDDIHHPSHPYLKDLWEEYKNRFSDYIFIEHSQGCGTGVAFKPPFDKLETYLDPGEKEVKNSKPNAARVVRKKDEMEDHTALSLPIHFLTIVLNGQPFIRHHIEVFRQLPFKWHWHIVEGLADLKHDTAWSLDRGGRISEQLHRNGLSNDGTTEYIDELARHYPANITVYRKPAGAFWDGKLEMVNAPLTGINEPCLLWQVDADELWTVEQIYTARDMFITEPDRTAAYYLNHFFVGENLVTTTIDTYGNNTSYEWLRTWRFKPGFRWATHEPPRLCKPCQGGQWVDVATIKPFKHNETRAKGLVFQHYAYATKEQVGFKEVYYGYKNAIEQWRCLQKCNSFPVFLRDYFAWVNDNAQVATVQSQNITPLGRKDVCGQWRFSFSGLPAKKYFAATKSNDDNRIKSVLWVRTDSIGDGILSSSMLPYVRKRFDGARITVLCQEHVAELYEFCPFIDRIIAVPSEHKWQSGAQYESLIREIQKTGPDILLNSTFSVHGLSDIKGLEFIPKRLAFRHGMGVSYTDIIPTDKKLKPELARHCDFLRGIGIDVCSLEPEMWITNDDEQFAYEIFKKYGFEPTHTIALFAGARVEHKIYEHYGLALREICKKSGYTVITLGAGCDYEINQRNLEAAGGRGVNLSGQMTLRQTAAILKRCRLAVGADTAIAHIACAVKTPNVILLGGAHFGRFMPYSPLTTAVSLPLECYGCDWQCRYDRVYCVWDVAAEVISEAIRQTLSGPSTKPRVFVQGASLWNVVPGGPRPKAPDKLINMNGVEVICVESNRHQAGKQQLQKV